MRQFQKNRVPEPRVKLTTRVRGRLDIEIGCGVGLHAVDYCRKNPKRTLIAIDKSQVRYQKMMDRIKKQSDVTNLIPIRENAIWFIAHEVQNNSVGNYFFLYPNPYPKKGQSNKRWHQMPFMQHVIDTLKKNGKIHLATNMKYYAEEAEEFFKDVWKLQLIGKSEYQGLSNAPFSPRTHFEKKYLERGQTCWNLIFQK